MRLVDRLVEQPDVAVPYAVWRFFQNSEKEVTFSGSQLSLGGDFGDKQEIRNALEWYVEQMGGKVKWEK